jgi:uncharacterized protein with von Willebrand factor type A (vWA) domain
MSDTTLYSGLYQQISEYAERIDEALITFVTQQPNPSLYRELGNILAQFADPHQGRLANRLIAQMILEDDAVGQNELEIASETLQTGVVDEITRDVIERLAHSLEQERTKAMARMRGELR